MECTLHARGRRHFLRRKWRLPPGEIGNVPSELQLTLGEIGKVPCDPQRNLENSQRAICGHCKNPQSLRIQNRIILDSSTSGQINCFSNAGTLLSPFVLEKMFCCAIQLVSIFSSRTVCTPPSSTNALQSRNHSSLRADGSSLPFDRESCHLNGKQRFDEVMHAVGQSKDIKENCAGGDTDCRFYSFCRHQQKRRYEPAHDTRDIRKTYGIFLQNCPTIPDQGIVRSTYNKTQER